MKPRGEKALHKCSSPERLGHDLLPVNNSVSVEAYYIFVHKTAQLY